MDVTHIIATNVKKLRERKKLTLGAAAELTSVSRSMLAQIEKGDVNPTISVLWKIANGFKVTFSALIERETEDIALIRNADIAPLVEDDGRYINYPIFSFNHKLFESYRIVIKPDGALSAQPHMTGTEEYITVFEGEVEITVGPDCYQLGPGDSIRFMADVAHRYRNCGTETAELSMLLYYNE